MKRVLIVDDAIDVCRMLQDALKTTYPEIKVSAMPSAEEALLESSRFTIDLLVTDIRLPGMTGLELVRKIRVRQPQVKIILMTGMYMDERTTRLKDEIAPDVFIRKPLHVVTFLDAVASLIGDKTPEEKTAPLRPPADNATPALVLREMAEVLPGEPAAPKPRPVARKGTGSLRLPPEPSPVNEGQGVSGVLTRLRVSLGATSVMLLDDRGRPVALAGDLPEFSLEDQLFPPVMAAVSAAVKIAYQIGQPIMQSVQAYRGADYDLVLAPVGQYVLLVVMRSEGTHLRLALAFEEAINAQAELSSALEAMGLHIQSLLEMSSPDVILAELEATQPEKAAVSPDREGPLEPAEPGLAQFEELFSGNAASQIPSADSDTFWETASGENSEISQPGVLSFDQASKLGLVPKEE